MSFIRITYINGTVTEQPLELSGNTACVAKESLGEGIDFIDFMPDFLTARVGDTGCMVIPSVVESGASAIVEFHERENTESVFRHHLMPIYGCVCNGKGYLGVVTGMTHEYSLVVGIRDGIYYMYPRFHLEGEKPYENLEVVFYPVSGKDATYAGMAAAYRNHQLATGAVRPLRQRAAERPALKYAVECPEVRLRLAWKPAEPSPVEEQTPENEPAIKVALTFDRVADIVDEFHRQGIDKSEFCLVGWNKSGHDGRFPDLLPVEPLLGGEQKLKDLIAKTRNYGYQIVAHTNLYDSYTIAKRWKIEDMLFTKDGQQQLGGCWGGGRSHLLCPQAAYKAFAEEDFNMLKGWGFYGLHYIDVLSILNVKPCHNPLHPLTRRGNALWRCKMLNLAQKSIGGSASEGSFDFVAPELDYVLYVYFNLNIKLPPICDRVIPLWMLVYHGILLYNAACECVNASFKSNPASALRNVEFGGKPTYYYYSCFTTTAWMGVEDLTCNDDKELHDKIAVIRKDYDNYQELKHLQYEFMTSHDEIAPKVFKTGYSNGQAVLTNYNTESVTINGVTLAPFGYALI